MSAPRIVVGMSVWNEERYLAETIPAVLAQTMPDFRLFLLDNGSTDGSWTILRAFADRDDRITLLKSPINLSPPVAANLGWGACLAFWPGCRWFVGAGADDLMDPDYLEAILATADARPDVNLIFSPMRFIGHPERGVWTYPPYDAARAHEQLFVPGWRAFTRELWDALGGEYTGLGGGADWEWICRASVRGVLRPYQLPRPYVSLRVRTERTTASDLADRPALMRRMRDVVAGAA